VYELYSQIYFQTKTNVLTRQNVTQMRYVQTLLDPIAVSAAMVILVMDKLAKVDLYRFIDDFARLQHVILYELFVFLDINECAVGKSSCSANAICLNSPGSFTCSCKQGFIGNGSQCDGNVSKYRAKCFYIEILFYFDDYFLFQKTLTNVKVISTSVMQMLTASIQSVRTDVNVFLVT